MYVMKVVLINKSTFTIQLFYKYITLYIKVNKRIKIY